MTWSICWDGGSSGELLKDLDAAGVDFRQAKRHYGTEARNRVRKPELWSDFVQVRIAYLLAIHPRPASGVIVTDVRYDHEIDALLHCCERLDHQLFYTEVHRLADDLDSPPDPEAHSSEAGIQGVMADHIVTNNGTRTALIEKGIRDAINIYP
jgi:hypothetical protein